MFHSIPLSMPISQISGKGVGAGNYKDKDKDKDKDVFIGPKEFVSHMMMTQTKYRLYHQLK